MQFYIFSIVQLVLVNLLIFKNVSEKFRLIILQNWEYVNFDLFFIIIVLLSRNLYMKYVGYSRFHGSSNAWFSMRRRPTNAEVRKAKCKDIFDKTFALNLTLALILLLTICIGWRVFQNSTFHNFFCLFYP